MVAHVPDADLLQRQGEGERAAEKVAGLFNSSDVAPLPKNQALQILDNDALVLSSSARRSRAN